MEAEYKPLTDEERREVERAKEVGRQMARGTIKKLKPQIKAIANVINEANDRIYEEGHKAGIREVVAWVEHRWLVRDEAWGITLKEWGIGNA